ncbi:MAG: hypothetical protein ACRC5M_00040, partial [Anaeroplasmataceae bacterium]
ILDDEEQVLNLQSGTTFHNNIRPTDINVHKLGICIPSNCVNYEEFKTNIHKNEKVFVQKLDSNFNA